MTLALPAPDEIQVWQARLDDPAFDVNALRQTLTPDETERAARFRFDQHRRHFIVGRGILRVLLAQYLAVDPADIRFGYTDKGRPFLVHPAAEGFDWNLSHSADLALFGFCMEARIGIDVEIIRPVDNIDAVARRFFSPSEFEMLRQLPESARLEGFFNCWTRKEAYIKAEGQGISMPLDSFTVSLVPGEAPRLIEPVSQWHLHDLRPAENAIAAIAVSAPNRTILVRAY